LDHMEDLFLSQYCENMHDTSAQPVAWLHGLFRKHAACYVAS
jgi:hypothetical protein